MTPTPRLGGTVKPEADLAVVLATEPALAHRKQESARLCGISPRLLERLLSAGKFPRPDAYAGRCPLWTRATLESWVAGGGGQI
jgi:predicted DNA-binding transcriptional regulator AlpA